MGAVHVTVTIRDPADPSRSRDGLFPVDTGTTDPLVPRSCIAAIGIAPEGQRVYETADGREIRMDFARAYSDGLVRNSAKAPALADIIRQLGNIVARRDARN